MHLSQAPFRAFQFGAGHRRSIAMKRISAVSVAILWTFLVLASNIHSTALAKSLSDNQSGDQAPTGAHNNLVNSHRQQQQQQQHQNSKLMASGGQNNGAAALSTNRCQSGWMWFNNKCWVTTQSRRDFAHAIELCKKMYNSTLPTIHSEDENEFLRNNIDLHNSPIWLFARHNHQYNKTRWLDKTPVNYTRWDSGQPSDKSSLVCIKTEDTWYMKKAEPVDGQTECVSFWEDAKWGTNVGCLVLLPVVCEKKLQPISRAQATMSGGNGDDISPFTGQSDTQLMNIVSAAQSIHNISQANLFLKSVAIYLPILSLLVAQLSSSFTIFAFRKHQL